MKDKIVKNNWKRNTSNCIAGLFGEGDVRPDSFSRSWQGLSPLFWRIPILLWSLLVLSFSMAYFWGPREKFFLYMTHWGLFLIVLESTFGIIVAVKKSGGVVPDATFGLPWYVKTYWLLYNITIPVSFLITVFYWGILRTSGKINFAPNPVLDVMLHGANSLVMLVELVMSAHPSRLLHVMQPLWFAGVYMLFSVIYFFAGGTDPWGNTFIYPVIDWNKPDQTMVVITLTALFLALMHCLVVGVASARDALANRCLRDKTGVYNDGFAA